MRWKLGDFEFNQHTNVLSNRDDDLLLEPKTAALLSYFLANPQKNISRDELLEHVWDGQIVSENAINRVVVRLRKALCDDEKIKSYIVTVPKTGYRFVASPHQITEKSIEYTQKSAPSKPLNGLLIICAIILAGWWFTSPETSTLQSNANVSPLIRLSGEQFGGATANTSDQLVYSSVQAEGTPLYWVEHAGATPLRISPTIGTSKNAHWSRDDSVIIYQYTHVEICEFRLVPFTNGKPQNSKTVYECSYTSDASFALSPDNRHIYFTERQNEFGPYAVYELDLTQGSKKRMSQPIATGLGNYHIDMSPTSGKLLLLSAEAPGQTSAFSLDLAINDYQKLHEFDYRVDYAVWGHQENTLVHMGEHPSYQLVETDFSSKEARVLITDSRRITEPKRVNNGKDYLFRSFLVNRDIAVNGEIQQDINSSVRDYLPVYSDNGSKLAFISKRAGYSQVWIKDYETGFLFPIEVQDKGRIYIGLAWSPDGTKLAANTDGGIILIDIESRKSSQTFKFALSTYALSWPDNNTLSYSHFVDGRWDYYNYTTKTSVSTPQDKGWAFSLRSQTKTLFLDQQLALHSSDGEVIDTSDCERPILRAALTFRLKGDKLYCLASPDGSTPKLLRFNGQAFEHFLTLPETTSIGYSVSNENVAVSVVSSASSDIMRTNFNN